MPRRRGRPPPGRTWPAPRGAAGRSGRAGRSDLPEISQFRGRHPYPDPPQTAHRQQKRRHFCRHILRKRYAKQARFCPPFLPDRATAHHTPADAARAGSSCTWPAPFPGHSHRPVYIGPYAKRPTSSPHNVRRRRCRPIIQFRKRT